ncbi:MAG: hypothetical protein AB1522_16300 [Chloroflexota bacterium]
MGWIILLGAIILNGLASRLRLTGWYAFLGAIAQHGWLSAITQTSIISHLFLFLVYPLALGVLAWLGWKITLWW